MPTATAVNEVVLQAALEGLTADPKTLSPWLFYDERGSRLFEEITTLPEYYLTRTERALLASHADEILAVASARPITVVELGAGTASKTGLLLAAALRRQGTVVYQPIDVSSSALDEACALEIDLPGLQVRPSVANYVTEPLHLDRADDNAVLALYIGSSIGNFSPAEARSILRSLRAQLRPGDSLLLGTDLAPGPNKSVATLISAYDDAVGVTAAFNGNILHRLNADLGANFRPECFAHRARWNAVESRMEMHLESLTGQTVHLPGRTLHIAARETIHTENSYKFTADALRALLADSGFALTKTWRDTKVLFAITLGHVLS